MKKEHYLYLLQYPLQRDVLPAAAEVPRPLLPRQEERLKPRPHREGSQGKLLQTVLRERTAW